MKAKLTTSNSEQISSRITWALCASASKLQEAIYKNFWFLLKLNKDVTVQEVLLHPETKIGICAGEALRKDTFPPPPKPDYWASIYFKLVR